MMPKSKKRSQFQELTGRANLEMHGPFGDVFNPYEGEGLFNVALRPQSSIFFRIFRAVIIIALLVVATAGTGAWIWLRDLGVFNINPEKIHAISHYRPDDNSIVYDRDGRPIGEFFENYHVHLNFDEIPKKFIEAVIAIEDRNFWQHGGYDPKAILRAVNVRLNRGKSHQGASTITQQVVRHFLLGNERTMSRKVTEIFLARELERHLSKKQIFEIYANAFFLGNGAYGVGAAAWRYFGKPAAQLSLTECALIAGLYQSPSKTNPTKWPARAKARQEQVLKAMVSAKFIEASELQNLISEKLAYQSYEPLNEKIAPYFIDYVREEASKILTQQHKRIESKGLRIDTTLDGDLQKYAESAIKNAGPDLDRIESQGSLRRNPRSKTKSNAPVIEASMLVTNPQNGEILAMVGGRDYRETQFNRAITASRSPGSAFKPAVYSLALANRWRWSDLVYVSPVSIDNYRPRTPNDEYATESTLLRAFFRSMNSPTIELGQKLGLSTILAHAKKLGIRSSLKDEFGTLLGGSEMTMPDLSRMYGVFANAGTLVEHVAIRQISTKDGKILFKAPDVEKRSTTVMSKQVAYLMTQGMRDVLAYGTGARAANLAPVAAGKTGTSNEATDHWFCGFTPDLEAVVWVGTDDHQPIYGDFTGGTVALPIWANFMEKALATHPAPVFPVPADVVAVKVHPRFGNLSDNGMTMFFIKGTEPQTRKSALEEVSKAPDGHFRDIFTR